MKNKEIEELLENIKFEFSNKEKQRTDLALTAEGWNLLLSYIEQLEKQAELGEHYKHLYSEVKKQKDDGIDWIKNNYCYVGKKMSLKPFSDLNDLLRMLGEIE